MDYASAGLPPSKLLLLLELRALGELGLFFSASPLLNRLPTGDGHAVMVLPGLGATDTTTWPLRSTLSKLGYAAEGWNAGHNTGRKELIEPLLDRIQAMYEASGDAVSLVGWSAGGLYARELAKLVPAKIRQVITLGSPAQSRPAQSNVHRIFQWLSGQAEPDPVLMEQLREPPPVPLTAIYTRSDGIVPWQHCMASASPIAENIEVRGSHCGLAHNPYVLFAIADRLSQPIGGWRPFQREGLRRFFFSANAPTAGFVGISQEPAAA